MHDVCHVEFMTKDMARLVEFYRELFGWKKTMDTPTYIILSPKDGPAVGFASAGEGMAAPMITSYVLVKDIAATLDGVRARGLEVVIEKTEVPKMGWFGLFKDPDGNVMGLWTSLRKAVAKQAKTVARKAGKRAAKRPKSKGAVKKTAKKAAKKPARKARARR